MNDPVEALIDELLEWIGPGWRERADVLEVWRTSCPRLPVWEEANLRGFIDTRHEAGRAPQVAVSVQGSVRLHTFRARLSSQIATPKFD